MKEGVKRKGWLLGATDKSGKLVLDLKDNYLLAMNKHAHKDILSSMEEVATSEGILYSHSTAICKIFGYGRGAGESEPDRIIESLKPVMSGVPALVGSRKDHKVGWDPTIGPPTRPICNAMLGPNSGLGNLTSRALRPIKAALNKQANTTVCSTEELLREFQGLNTELSMITDVSQRPQRTCKDVQVKDQLVVGSMDVAALYPSCKIRETQDIIRKVFTKGVIEYTNIDINTMTRYLALTQGRTSTPLDKYLPIPKRTTDAHRRSEIYRLTGY